MISVIRALRLVYRKHVIVHSQTITVRIGIGNQTRLQHLVRRISHTRHYVARFERRLLDFREIIYRIAVQDQFADFLQRIILVRPNFRQVERIEVIRLGLFFRHDLDGNFPLREVAFGDRVEQIALRVIRVLTAHFFRGFSSKVLDSLLGLKVPFHVEQLVLIVDQAEGVAAEAVHLPVAVRRSAIRKENRHLMQRFRRKRPEIPHHCRGLQICFRIALLCVNKIAELQRVADEKYRCVVAGHVPVAFLGVKLQRKAARIAFRVGRTLFPADRREPDEGRGLFPNGVEQLCRRIFRDGLARAHKIPVRAGSLCVDHPFRNTLAVKVRHLFEQKIIFKNDRPARSHGERILVVAHGTPRVRCHCVFFFLSHLSSQCLPQSG